MNQNNIWKKALKVIPGGNGLLSKRPGRFLDKGWPIYFKKAKGINLWDLNSKKYIDFSIMGVGTAILGYANKSIDDKVKQKIDEGINTTLNCLEEYLLAKELLKWDPFADQVKFAKGGGEAMSMAIRIARANTKETTIAFSGYHGWHDWYLSANIANNKNLNNHLLKNLKPLGVPKGLRKTIVPFKFNDFNSLQEAIKKNKDVGIVVIEGARYEYLSKSFVNKLNKLKREKKIILIVDEITSGWRECFGGVYKKFNLKPDLVIYGKALANGYAISAVLGKKKIMQKASETFISSTAWTERVGFVAALATIDFLKNKKVFKHITSNGKLILNKWVELAKKHNLQIKTNKFLSMPSFEFTYGKNSEKLHTYFTELMIKRGYLATNYMTVTYAHKNTDISKYIKNCDEVFKIISNGIVKNKISLKNPVRKMTY
jgi:glutamate-1-semialdehyde 2,1-aminomutase